MFKEVERAVAATVAFYVGIAFILVGIVAYGFGVRIIGIRPISYVHFANSWFLIALICFAHDMCRKVVGGSKKPEEAPKPEGGERK